VCVFIRFSKNLLSLKKCLKITAIGKEFSKGCGCSSVVEHCLAFARSWLLSPVLQESRKKQKRTWRKHFVKKRKGTSTQERGCLAISDVAQVPHGE
jgi:hypothetical protein